MKKVNMLFLGLTSVFSILYCASSAEGKKLTIKVTPPQNYSSKDSIHIVGSFNDWALEGVNAYELYDQQGTLTTQIPIVEANTFFTFVRNKDYQYMPASKKGKSHCTYLYQALSEKSEISIKIPAWKKDEPTEDPIHTSLGYIKHHTDFDMPQLSRKGDIAVYLPESYRTNTRQSYPVLYMLDGQNIFDEFSSYGEEWRVDETLQELTSDNSLREIIVVAIPNGPRRWIEYNPWNFKNGDGKLEVGEGDYTIRFIIETLKPFIDKKYRTQPKNKTTGLSGSSLGGLMALYAAIEYDNVFGFVGAFSPALAIENQDGDKVLFEAIKEKQNLGNSKTYFDIGEMEYGNYEKVEELHQLLLLQGAEEDNLRLVKDDLGRHCERDWSKRFPDAIKWMLENLDK